MRGSPSCDPTGLGIERHPAVHRLVDPEFGAVENGTETSRDHHRECWVTFEDVRLLEDGVLKKLPALLPQQFKSRTQLLSIEFIAVVDVLQLELRDSSYDLAVQRRHQRRPGLDDQISQSVHGRFG